MTFVINYHILTSKNNSLNFFRNLCFMNHIDERSSGVEGDILMGGAMINLTYVTNISWFN
jgi:hypothetical protein